MSAPSRSAIVDAVHAIVNHEGAVQIGIQTVWPSGKVRVHMAAGEIEVFVVPRVARAIADALEKNDPDDELAGPLRLFANIADPPP